MIDNKNKKLVRDCGVKASIVRSDHKGVMMKLNMKIKRLQKKPKDKLTVRINKDFSKLSLTAKSGLSATCRVELDATGAIPGRGPADPSASSGKPRKPSRARAPKRGRHGG